MAEPSGSSKNTRFSMFFVICTYFCCLGAFASFLSHCGAFGLPFGSLWVSFWGLLGPSWGLLEPSWASLGPPGSLLGAFLALWGGPERLCLATLSIFNVSRGLQKPSGAFFNIISAYLEASGHLFQRFFRFWFKISFLEVFFFFFVFFCFEALSLRLLATRSQTSQCSRLWVSMGPAGWAKPK